jgi:hypothetical protein
VAAVPEEGKQKNGGEPADQALRELAPVATVVTTLAGIFAAIAFTGVLARTWRNQLELTLASFGLVLLAGLVLTVGRSHRTQKTRDRGREQKLAPTSQSHDAHATPPQPNGDRQIEARTSLPLLALLMGLVWMISRSRAERDRPRRATKRTADQSPAEHEPSKRPERHTAVHPNRSRNRGRRSGFLTVLRTPEAWAGLLFAAGILVGIVAVGLTYGESEKPTITAELEPGLVLKANVHVAGLSSNQKLAVRVSGFRRKTPQPPQGSPWEGFTLYDAAFGPNVDGVVEHPIHFAIAPGTYELVGIRARVGDTYEDCSPNPIRTATSESQAGEKKHKMTKKTGCLLLALPRFEPFPRLTAKFTHQTKRTVLHLHVVSDNTPHRVGLFVISTRQRPLAETLLMPDLAGRLDESLDFEIPKSVQDVCAIARWYRPGERSLPPRTPRCPPRTMLDTSWVTLRAEKPA